MECLSGECDQDCTARDGRIRLRGRRSVDVISEPVPTADPLAQLVSLGCRILHAEGHEHLCFGHVSARDEQGDGFHVKVAGLGLDEVTDRDVALVDRSGAVTPTTARMHDELPLHREIYASRGNVNAIAHTHADVAVVASLEPSIWAAQSQDGVPFVGRLAFFEDSALITTAERGRQLVAALGGARAILLQGHGLVTVGSTVQEAVVNAVQLRRALATLLLARITRVETVLTAEQVLALDAQFEETRNIRLDTIWAYLVRRLERDAKARGVVLLP